ncbi:MAG: hypothetical protein PF569_05720 [Candidatus Woesearchaeota archaeon]|jgi:hypothetical protein|nr:hypothetical protein [Candidatus Woesearchaeota archaeon]
MSNEIINPFKQVKKTDWSKKSNERLNNLKTNKVVEKTKFTGKPSLGKLEKPLEKEKIQRIAKSFKIYPGDIGRDFDKRINKMQVHFDDLDFDKDYVDSGKYLMFIMAFAEKYKLYELYEDINDRSDLDISKSKLTKHFN